MVDSPVVWVSTREVATRVAPLLTRHVDEQTRLLAAALVLDCLASSGVLAMTPAQPPLGLNLKDSPLARRYASDSPQECYSWHYDSRAALWLLEYAAHCPDVVAAVDARLYLDSATRVLSWSRFVVGLSPSGVAAAVEWRARNLPPALLARDAPAAPGGSAHRHGGGPAPLSRAPLLLQVRQHMAADAMVQAPSHRAPWASMSAAPPTQMRSILHEEERAGRSRAAVPPHAQAAAVAPVLQRPHVPPRPVPGAAPSHPRAQSIATAAAPAVRVLQRSGQPMSWAQTVAAPPLAPSQSQPEHGAGAGDNISGSHAPRLLHAEARKSPMDTTGRVRCLSCGRQFSAYAHLQDHVDACHAGVNSADPGVVAAAAEAAKRDAGRTPGLPGGSKAKRSPLMLSDLLDLRPTPGSAANSLLLHVKAAVARKAAGAKDAAAGGGSRSVALGFTARPKAGGQLMVNPNTASGVSVIVRRGKERQSGKKKRVSTLKKIILRERAAKESARSAAGLPPVADAGDQAAGGAGGVEDGDATEASGVEAAEDVGDADGVVVHVARDHVYVSLEACPDEVRVHMLSVEAQDEDSDSDSGSDSDGMSSSSASSGGDDDDEDGAADDDEDDDDSLASLEREQEAAMAGGGPDPNAAAAPALPALALRIEAAPFVPGGGRASSSLDAPVTACALCGVQCGTTAVLDQHMRGKAHAKRVRAAAAGQQQQPPGGDTGGEQPAVAAQGGRECRYGRQVVTPALNGATAALLTRLLELQARLRAREPLKAKARQRLVFGLRECGKALRTRRAKALFVAPNVEQVLAPGGLDDAVDGLLEVAHACGVPVVLALTRARMGALTGRRVKMSAACVLDPSGCEDALKGVLRMAEEGAAQWEKLHPNAAPLPSVAPADDTPLLMLRRDGRHRALRLGEEAVLRKTATV